MTSRDGPGQGPDGQDRQDLHLVDFFPSLLTPRRRIDVALHAVVMEAYVHGASTRKVDDLVIALGAESGISKSEVSRICAELDTDVAAFNPATWASSLSPTRSWMRRTARAPG